VFEPGIILGQMQLRNFLMLKIFLTAVATGLVVLAVLNGFGFTTLYPKATLYGADFIGGGLLGAVVFTYVEPTLKPVLLSGGPGKLTLAGITGVPFWLLALGFAVVLVAGLVGLERWRSWRDEIGPAADGLRAEGMRDDAPRAGVARPAL